MIVYNRDNLKWFTPKSVQYKDGWSWRNSRNLHFPSKLRTILIFPLRPKNCFKKWVKKKYKNIRNARKSSVMINIYFGWTVLNFPACTYKSQNVAQSQLNFAPSHYGETVTFRNSVDTWQWHVTGDIWHITCFCPFLSVPARYCPLLSISVCFCQFLSVSVCCCPFLLFFVYFCLLLSVFDP